MHFDDNAETICPEKWLVNYPLTNNNQRGSNTIASTLKVQLIVVSSVYLLRELSCVSIEVPPYLKVTFYPCWATNGQGDNRSGVIRESSDITRSSNILCERIMARNHGPMKDGLLGLKPNTISPLASDIDVILTDTCRMFRIFQIKLR